MTDSVITFSEYIETGPTLLNDKNHRIQATFRVAPVHVTIANTIRRQILASIPTVGFKTEPPENSDVHITTNTTPLVNEMLMHRIGMIPIAIADPSTFNPDDYEFRINIENIGKSLVNVSASDFVVVKSATTEEAETHLPVQDFFPVDPITEKTPLITVLRQQYNMDSPPEKLVIRAKASIGTGRENMRFSPVTQCSYEYTRDMDESRQNLMFTNWMATSKKVLDTASISPERLNELRREFDCLEVQRCYLQNEKGEPYDFIFHIESVGVYSVPVIVERGLRACENIVTPYISLDTSVPENLEIRPLASRMGGQEGVFEFIFRNEEHTLGNLLQTFLVERHIEGTEMPRITYAGYRIPHPLKQEMVLTINPIDGDSLTARKAIASVCKYLKSYFASATTEWVKTPKGELPKVMELPQSLPVKTRGRAKK
jgi:DNA-directed RNA polymerase subunit L/DNA-directed RNA polymerase alpha subunit